MSDIGDQLPAHTDTIQNMRDMQLFFSEKNKRYHMNYLKKLQRRRTNIRLFYLFMLFYSSLVLVLWFFAFGRTIIGAICLITSAIASFSIILIKLNINLNV